jgi:biopolymer transport protein TolQ
MDERANSSHVVTTSMSVSLSPVLASTNIIDVFEHCDIVGQTITSLLAVFSVIAWAVMFGKRAELNSLRRMNRGFERHLRDQKTVLDLPESLRERRDIPYADLFSDAVEAYWRAAAIGKEKGTDSAQFRLEHAENALQRALARQTLRYESSMIFLASIVSGAPFLGLLGTVWGVMDAFSAVSLQQTASIQTLAPGVSAALLTTISGLLVAIPCLFGYNWLLAMTKQLITELENYASSLADRIELESK